MARGNSSHSTTGLDITAEERAVLDLMKVAAGVASDANLFRIALWSLGDHLDVEMPNGVFDLRTWEVVQVAKRVSRRVANPQVRQDAPRPKPKKPAPDHPWREPLADLLPKKGA